MQQNASQPAPSTTGSVPAGAATADKLTNAMRTASFAHASARTSPSRSPRNSHSQNDRRHRWRRARAYRPLPPVRLRTGVPAGERQRPAYRRSLLPGSVHKHRSGWRLLPDAFVGGTRHAVYAAQNIQFLFAAHALQRINRGVKRLMLHRSQRFYFAVTAVTHDSTGSMSTLLQRQQANLVCIGKPCFSPLMARTPTP